MLKDAIVLGLPFLRSFVATYNYSDSTVNFAINANAIDGTKLVIIDTSKIYWLNIVLIISAILITAIALLFLLRCIIKSILMLKRDKLEREANAILYS